MAVSGKAAPRSCSVDKCERPVQAKGLCNPHYFRLRRNGETGSAEIGVKNPDAPCEVDDCDKTVRGGSNGMCPKHATRVARHGDAAVVLAPEPHFGERNHLWTGSDATYNAVHTRLRNQRGSAREQMCGCGNPAAQWAYDHADPNGRVAEEGPYSVNLDHYEAKCVPCHKRGDLARFNVPAGDR